MKNETWILEQIRDSEDFLSGTKESAKRFADLAKSRSTNNNPKKPGDYPIFSMNQLLDAYMTGFYTGRKDVLNSLLEIDNVEGVQ